MRVLLTNDDGIEAAGIAALEAACASLGELAVVAPVGCRSYIGHQVTVGKPLHVERRGADRFTVDGTPADCVRLALTHLAPGMDLVVSGINHGANLGVDLYTSGTAAAAREAAFLGVPAIACSHYKARGLEFNWEWATRQMARVLPELLRRGCPPRHFWSVNLPHTVEAPDVPELCFVPVDPSPHDVRFEPDGDSAYRFSGEFWARPHLPGYDVAECFAGKITVSLVTVCGTAVQSQENATD